MYDSDQTQTEFGDINVVEQFKSKYGIAMRHKLPIDTELVLKKVDSNSPAIRPITDESPTPIQLEEWKKQFLSLFGDKVTASRVADTLLGSLRRVSEAEFEEKLVMSYKQAVDVIEKEDLKKASFIYYSGGRRRSNEWVREIVRDYWPQDTTLELPPLDYYDKNLVNQCDIGIIMDDASYSGQQITDHIRRGHDRFGMKRFYVVIPFMTNMAKTQIEKLANELGVEVEMFVQEIIPTLDETLDDTDFKWLKNASPSYRLTNEQTTTYFAHKVPDYRSFCPYIGYTRHVQAESHLQSLIVQRPAIYHMEYLDDLKRRGLLE